MKAGTLNRIPSLDGLRAISILLVVISHSFSGIKHYLDIGNLGVRMFFVISSYLIAGILYRDVVKKRFSIKTFYFKRLMRTFPAFYFYLGILAIVLFATNHFDWSQFWYSPFYLENYHPRNLWTENQWFTGHTWSLAVEEQFYLVIAVLFSIFYKGKIEFKQLIAILIAVIILVPLTRLAYMTVSSIPEFLRGSTHRSFETVADSLATGAILALIKSTVESKKMFKVSKNFLWILIVLVFAVLFTNSSFATSQFGHISRFFYNGVGIFIINSTLGILMLHAIAAREASLVFKVLNFKPLVTIGLLSYSIYLWQQLWLFSWPIPLWAKWIGIAVSATISYYFIEEKFLKLRDRMLLKKNEKTIPVEIR